MTESGSDFEPRILGILCNWCAYAGADLAGVSRIQYTPNIRVVRVMCSGRVEPVIVLDAFINGADGVLIAGCHPGDCHYQSGNYNLEHRIKATDKLISKTKFEKSRLRLEWVSASEGQRFADVVNDFTAHIRKLGPNPLRSGGDADSAILVDLKAARETLRDEKLRTLIGKVIHLTEKENVYGDKVPEERYLDLIDETLNDVFLQQKIIQLVLNKALSVKELAKDTGLSPHKVLQHIVVLRKNNHVTVSEIDGTTPKYLALVQKAEVIP